MSNLKIVSLAGQPIFTAEELSALGQCDFIDITNTPMTQQSKKRTVYITGKLAQQLEPGVQPYIENFGQAAWHSFINHQTSEVDAVASIGVIDPQQYKKNVQIRAAICESLQRTFVIIVADPTESLKDLRSKLKEFYFRNDGSIDVMHQLGNLIKTPVSPAP